MTLISFKNNYNRVLHLIERIEIIIGLSLLAFIVLSICFQVFTRAVWGKSQIWVEELSTYGFIWAAFLGAAIGTKHRRHIRISTFIFMLSRKNRYIVAQLTYLVMFIILFLIVMNAPALHRIETRSNIIAIPFVPRFYVFSGPLILALGSMMITIPYLMITEHISWRTGGTIHTGATEIIAASMPIEMAGSAQTPEQSGGNA